MTDPKKVRGVCAECGEKLAKIEGRVFKKAVEQTGTQGKYPRIPSNRWVSVCPICDAYALGIETFTPWPFISADGVIRTALDYGFDGHNRAEGERDFCGLRLSDSAFHSLKMLTDNGIAEEQDTVSLRESLRVVGLEGELRRK